MRTGSCPTDGITAPAELVRILALIGVKRSVLAIVPSELPVAECLRSNLLPGQFICSSETTPPPFRGLGERPQLDAYRDSELVVIEVSDSEVRENRATGENHQLKAGFYLADISAKQVKSVPAFRAGQIVSAHKGGTLHLIVWWGDKRDAKNIRILEIADDFLPSASKDLDTYEFAPTANFAARLSLTICNSADLKRLRDVSITLGEVLASDPRVIYRDKEGTRLWKRLTNGNNGKVAGVQTPSTSRRPSSVTHAPVTATLQNKTRYRRHVALLRRRMKSNLLARIRVLESLAPTEDETKKNTEYPYRPDHAFLIPARLSLNAMS